MKQLTSSAPERQELWRHKSREYSIVDLQKPIADFGGMAHAVEFMLMGMHPSYRFEVAEIESWPYPNAQDTYDSLKPLRRYRTIEDARDAIESGMIHEG